MNIWLSKLFLKVTGASWFIYLKIGLIAVVLSACFGAGWYLSEKIRVNPIQIELKEVKKINIDNVRALEDFKKDTNKLIISYEKRLKAQTNTINSINQICNLHSGGKPNGEANSGDDISNMLNGLFPNR